ncbi:retrotransposon nucleocapsid protein [Lasallia pustulata]|uniref:Retrotransposon nucleocapsid protein n=1 Tax=Lasallia pustulata TaxID=136370 RepID=A0A1W5CRQ9_9LECA|nr:retrotransposon nucleocapsid protein [Lasallia pustulata]
MLRERADHNALPEHQTWDHKISIVPGKSPEKQPIYLISEAKLEVLRKYIDENKANRFIRESTSPVGYPILFVQKKDGTQQLCVNYRKLNAITVKNSYPLPLISELQDCLQKAKWFTKLDVQQAYYCQGHRTTVRPYDVRQYDMVALAEQTATSEHSDTMAPTLQSGQASKTVDNQSGQASETVDDQTAPAIDTPDTANGGEGAAAKAGNSNDTNNNIEAATAHNQEVIEHQRRQIQYVRQDIKYKENKRELERLNAR